MRQQAEGESNRFRISLWPTLLQTDRSVNLFKCGSAAGIAVAREAGKRPAFDWVLGAG